MLNMAIFAAGFLIGMGSLFALYSYSGKRKKKNSAEIELGIAKEIIASGVAYYKKLDRILQEIRILRHDYKYQIGVIEELAKISNAKHINEFLESTKKRFIQTEPLVYCENMIVNALLAHYSERFAGNNIPFHVRAALPAEIRRKHEGSLDNYEVCVVLGNLLENSMEGTMTVPPEERRVSMAVRLAEGRLLIEVQNTFDGKLVFGKGLGSQGTLPKTRKTGGGYGIMSIMAVCKRHGGEYLPQWSDKEYTVRIFLNV